MRELGLECALAIVELGHCDPLLFGPRNKGAEVSSARDEFSDDATFGILNRLAARSSG